MKKMTKLLSVFMVAGAMAGAVAVAGCSHHHTYDGDWSTDGTSHWHQATCEHSGLKTDEGEHEFGDDLICDICGYTKTGTETPPDNPNPPVVSEKMSEADFKAAIQATLDATAFTYSVGGATVKLDGAKNAFEVAGGSYSVYDAAAKKLTAYSPIADIAWEKEELPVALENFAAAKELMTGGMSLALNAFMSADYSSVNYDEATGKYSVGTAYITFEGGKVSSFGAAEAGEVTLSDYGGQITLPDFSLAFENIVSVNIAKNAAGSKLAVKTETSGYGLFAEKDDEQGYITAGADGYKQTVVQGTVNSGAYLNFAGLGGTMEGYFEVSASAMGSKWDIIQVRNGETKLFSVRTSDDKNSFMQKKGEETTYTKADGFTVAPAENTKYIVKYSLVKDATTGNYKLNMTINGQAFATDYDLGSDSVDNIYLTSSNVAKGPRVLTLDNVIICGTPADGSEIVNVTEITLNKYETRIEEIGATETLAATVAPENATNKTLVWSSSDTSVATVDANGKVTAVKKGTAVITAMASNGKTVKCTVTVGEKPKPMITVTFVNGDDTWTETAEQGGKVLKPTGVTKEGYTLLGWTTVKDSTDLYDFNTPVEKAFTLYAVWEKGTSTPVTPPDDPKPPVELPPIQNSQISFYDARNEGAAFEWADNNIANAKVEYKLANSSTYTLVDKELIRQKETNVARVDILGLKGDATYDFKITTSAGEELKQEGVRITAYDRSGYAHFNYSDGVGAYNDDGTLKDNALVIYVTDENKDTVMKEVCAANSDVPMFKIPGSDWGNKDADGIGWWLNNNQYTASNAGSKKNKVPSNTYDQANGGKLSFKAVNRPIVIRFIGTVTTPEGCTAYNDTKEGGGVGDNGHMARLKNLKNVTLEGVGEDAVIKGWGFHFVIGTDAVNGQGTSFEVRNLTFSEYPEDAVGMEGQQSGGKITAGVERCWIHHNTFLPGHCANPAESDKAEGDGSCDFKRGQYFTCSYNWFEYCHKTNLVGSADDSLQYNMTYHHNVWWQCGSRIPLTRQANVHFYNNYVYGNAEEKTTPYSWVKVGLSYVHSLRANCYIFSEGNYYDGCKNVAQTKGTGAAKGWNNTFYACIGDNTMQTVSSREQAVSNNCAYNGTSYATFDTDPNLFYYDATAKKTKAYVTDSVTARKECLLYAGVQKHSYEINTSMLNDSDKPAAALDIGSGLTIDVSQATVGGTVNGVKFVTAKRSSAVAKGGKGGPLATFTLADRADISLSGTAIELIREDGLWIASGSYTGTIPAGTYLITSSEKAKEGSISELSFKSGVTDGEKVQNVINYINAIGEVAYTEECKNKIAMAQAAYAALGADLRKQVTNQDKLVAAAQAYDALAVAPVIEKIAAIGTVNADSGVKITAARTAYNALTVEQKSLVTNYNVLTAAETAYESFEIEGINKQIAALAAPSTATTEEAIESLLDKYNAVKTMYADLDEDQKTQVTGYSKVTEGITALENALKPYTVRDMIAALPVKAEVTLSHSAAVTAARTAYNALTAEQKTAVGDITKLTDAEEVMTTLASQSKVAIFQKGKPELANGFTVNGSGYKGSSQKFTYDGVEYHSPLKMESATSVTFKTGTKMKVTIHLYNGSDAKDNNITLDGTSYTADANGDVEVIVEAGDHTIVRTKNEAWLCYVVLSPVAE